MKTANVSQLKSRLSSYLDAVQEGEEIVVRDRDRPIARIVPLTVRGGDDFEEAALVASGVMTLPQADELPPSFWRIKAGRVSQKRAVRVVREERDED